MIWNHKQGGGSGCRRDFDLSNRIKVILKIVQYELESRNKYLYIDSFLHTIGFGGLGGAKEPRTIHMYIKKKLSYDEFAI